MKQQDTFKETRIFEYEGAVARVHIPDLTEAERKRRIDVISKAAVQLLLSREK